MFVHICIQHVAASNRWYNSRMLVAITKCICIHFQAYFFEAIDWFVYTKRTTLCHGDTFTSKVQFQNFIALRVMLILLYAKQKH